MDRISFSDSASRRLTAGVAVDRRDTGHMDVAVYPWPEVVDVDPHAAARGCALRERDLHGGGA
ncbi:MAG: hypothetical protein RBR02_09855 [Desulfuromonadaceae bacterium]|nr:hypothetical protein [Desulfuromonadaceae bacterium]